MEPTLRAELREMPRAFWVLCAGTLLNRFGSFVFPFIALYATHRGLSELTAGFAVGAYGAGGLVSALIGGEMADRLGRRQTMVASLVGSAASMAVLGAASAAVPLIAAAAAAGFTTELYRPAASALIADLVPPERRIAAYGAYRLAINLGFAAGPAVAGFLAASSYTWLFLGDAVSSLLFAVILLTALPRDRPSTVTSQERPRLRELRGDRDLMLFLASAMAISLVVFQFIGTLPLHTRDAGHSTQVYGALIALNGALIVVFELALTSWTRRRDARRAIALGNLLVGLGFFAGGFVDAAPLLALTVVVWTVGEMVSAPVSIAYLSELAPPGQQGRYQGAFNLTFSVGLVLGPVLGTAVYAVAPDALWIACLVLGVASAAITLRLRPAGSPRTPHPLPAGSSP